MNSTSNLPKTNEKSEMKKTWANVAKTVSYPKKEQGILFPALDGIPILKYVVGLGSIIGPKKIIFSSRISNNRIAIFLNSKESVDDFLKNHQGITIDDKLIPCRKLINPSKRIIISNAPPFIPNEIIEQKLKDNNLTLVSPVTYIRAGIKVEGYEHILSFRRHVFISSQMPTELPTTLTIEYEGDNYRIFLGGDELKCFTCNEEGHISSKCPYSVNNKTQTSSEPFDTLEKESNKRPHPESIDSNSLIDFDSPINNDKSETKRRFIELPTSSNKTADDIKSQETAACNDDLTKDIKLSEQNKPKSRKESNLELESGRSRSSSRSYDRRNDLIDAIRKTIVDKSLNLKIDIDDLLGFINETFDNKNVNDIVENYTSDISQLSAALKSIRLLSENQSVKNRLQRIITKLKNSTQIVKNKSADQIN